MSALVLFLWLADSSAHAWLIGIAAGCVAVAALAELLPRLVARRKAAARGITLGRPQVWRTAQHVNAVLLDAHGTVTDGELEVVAISPVEPDHDRNLRWFAGALCHAYPHPVGRAVAKLSGRGRLSDVEPLGDVGVSGSVDRHIIRVGRPEWLEVETPEGIGTHIGVEVDARPMGHISVAPVVRPHARDAVQRLADLGIEPLLVTDLPSLDTDRIADAAGITTRWAETAPEKRGRLVTELRERGKAIAMVGQRLPQPDAHDEATLSLTDDADGDLGIDDFDVSLVADAFTVTRSLPRVLKGNRAIALIAGLVALGLSLADFLTPQAPVVVLVVGALAAAGHATRAGSGLAPLTPAESADDP